MAVSLNGKGYKIVSLNHPILKKKTKTVHTLVAKEHVPNPYNYKVVNHLFGNKLDNRACVLEWTTSAGNVQHSYDTGLKKKGAEHCAARKVIDTNTLKIYGTVREAAKDLKINENTLYYYLSGKRINKTTLSFL